MSTFKSFLYFTLFYGISCQPSKDFTWNEGDILFQDGECGDFCEAIRKVTHGYQGTQFSHNGLIININENWMVLEAVTSGVKTTPLEVFLDRHLDENGNPKVHVGRLKTPYLKLIPEAISHAQKLIGKPYDHGFDLFNDAYYCSELIHLSFEKANLGNPVFEIHPMTFIDPDTGETFPIWIKYFEKLGIPVPEGEPGLNPAGMTRDPVIEMVFDFTKKN
ncbi:MAG: YiiX/YebB-like N1pC/P60 family cysteine hydrolase [Cyclobacteriaceae bacterium]